VPSSGRPAAPPHGDAFEVIARVLVPYLGEAMARAAVQVNRDKLGLRGSTIDAKDLGRLIDALTPGLHVFVGHDRTQQMMDEIRAALGGAK
jgi:hypothetical protein